MPNPDARDPSTAARANTPSGSRRFAWHRCPEHSDLVLSVLDVEDCQPWCVGDGDTVPGHWIDRAELEQAA